MSPRNITNNQSKSGTAPDLLILVDTRCWSQHDDSGHAGDDEAITKSQHREAWSNPESKKARDQARRAHRDNKAAFLMAVLPGDDEAGWEEEAAEEEATEQAAGGEAMEGEEMAAEEEERGEGGRGEVDEMSEGWACEEDAYEEAVWSPDTQL
ncbi:hypothetical protein BT67DRAFT_454235 [Trichocladium antarcticum]|uniref:Uncharacterized protein n=1 Tax=Trichocladium antarcticum TaxID=1450529 RepID=A0AAN6ZG79_9PEZI|nr:hypothetical protein BT67DRAFT_454235 [Trichocladium antarcticum]